MDKTNERMLQQGSSLEDLYRSKLINQLKTSVAQPEQTADLIMAPRGGTEGMLMAPVYQELNQIPMNDQVDMVKQRLLQMKNQTTPNEYIISGENPAPMRNVQDELFPKRKS